MQKKKRGGKVKEVMVKGKQKQKKKAEEEKGRKDVQYSKRNGREGNDHWRRGVHGLNEKRKEGMNRERDRGRY